MGDTTPGGRAFGRFCDLQEQTTGQPFANFAQLAAPPPQGFANFAQLASLQDDGGATPSEDALGELASHAGDLEDGVTERAALLDAVDDTPVGVEAGADLIEAAAGEGSPVEALAIRPGAAPVPIVDSDALLQFLQSGEGRGTVDPQVHELLSTLLSGHLKSDSAMSELTGVDRRRVPTHANRMACACIQLERHQTDRIVGQLTDAVLSSGGKALLFVESMRGDETPMRISAKAAAGAQGQESAIAPAEEAPLAPETLEQEVAPHKIVQTEWLGSALYELVSGKHLLVSFPLVTWLQVVTRTTGECYKKAFENVAPAFECAARFNRKVRILTSDRDGAIRKAERNIGKENPDVAPIHFNCHVHQQSSVIDRVSTMLKTSISCLVELTLTLNQAGSMSGFRKALRAVLAEVVVHRRGVPPREHGAHRTRILDLLFAGSPKFHAPRRAAVEALANGDWSQQDIVEHWSTAEISRDALIKRFQKVFVWAVASAAPRVFPRHRWTGAEDSMRWTLLLMCCHGLLLKVYNRYIGKQGGGEGAGGGGEAGEEPAAEGGPEGAPGPNPPRADLDIIRHDPAAANVVPDLVSRYKEELSAWKRNAAAWLSAAESRAELLLFRSVHEGHRQAMHELLTMSGIEWHRRQAWRELQCSQDGRIAFDSRDFRVTVAESGRPGACHAHPSFPLHQFPPFRKRGSASCILSRQHCRRCITRTWVLKFVHPSHVGAAHQSDISMNGVAACNMKCVWVGVCQYVGLPLQGRDSIARVLCQAPARGGPVGMLAAQ